MLPRQLQLLRNTADTTLNQRDLSRRINPRPLLRHTHGPGLAGIHGRVDQPRRDTPLGRGRVVLGAHDKDVVALGPRDADLERLVVRVVEGLHERVKLVVEARLGAFEDEVE
jgi:hypothetical protein